MDFHQHAEEPTPNTAPVTDGGIVRHKCAWCGAENALPHTAEICPSCRNYLDGRMNDRTKAAMQHYENGMALFQQGAEAQAVPELQQFLEIEKDFESSAQLVTLAAHANPLELALLEAYYKKPVFNIEPPFAAAYCALGTAAMHKKAFDKAREYLDKACEWNRYYPEAVFKRIEIYRAEGNIEYFYRMTLMYRSRLYWPADCGRYYSNLAYYFSQKQNPRLAQCLLEYSRRFMDSETVDRELETICQTHGLPSVTVQEAEPEIQKAGLPMPLHSDVEDALKAYYYSKPTIVTHSSADDELTTEQKAIEYIFDCLHINYQKIHTEKYCPRCGSQQELDAAFCSKCGTPIEIEPDATVYFCSACHGNTMFGDRFCRHCGIALYLMDAEQAITDEDDICNAQNTVEKLMAAYERDNHNDWVVAHLMELIGKTPLYFAVNIDVQSLLGNLNPADLKPGDVITNQHNVRAKIQTAFAGDIEIVPVFTKSEYANASAIRYFPQDYLPLLVKMNMPVVVNAYNKVKFVVPFPFIQKFAEQVTVGTVIRGRYRLTERIRNVGTNTALYRATDLLTNAALSVKVLDKNAFKDESMRNMYIQNMMADCRFRARISHPGIAHAEWIDEENYAFLISEEVQGEFLDTIIEREGVLPEQTVLHWAKQLCGVLMYLSSLTPPVIQRGLTPASILIQPDGSIKLTDFSVARVYVPGLQADETCLGVKGYAPPEQFGTAQTDCRSDIYSLGAVMHQLLTGVNPTRPPYEQKPVRTCNAAVSEGMEYIVAKCLQPNPANRYQTPAALLEDLNHINKLPPKWGLFKKIKK